MDQTDTGIYGTFITDLLITLQRYHNTTPETQSGLKTFVAIDECRSLFPKALDNDQFGAGRFLEQFVTTARASGIARMTDTQEPQSNSQWLTNNSAFFLTFPIAGEAIDDIKRFQNLDDVQAGYLFKLPERGTGIFRDRRFDRPYLLQVPPVVEVSEITTAEVEALMRPYLNELQKGILPKGYDKRIKDKPYSQAELDRIKSIIHADRPF